MASGIQAYRTSSSEKTEAIAEKAEAEAEAKAQAEETEVFLKFSSFMNQLLRYAQSYPG